MTSIEHFIPVPTRLAHFDVTAGELIDIVRAVVAARADATADDPAAAEGLLAYIYGTRFTRQLFGSKGWRNCSDDNVASVKHPDRNLKVVYQSVDRAADWHHKPQAVSGKGSGADRLICTGQGQLFPEHRLAAMQKTGNKPQGVWFFCVSVDGDDVRAELSRPNGLAGNNFESFAERLFVLEGGEWSRMAIVPDRGPAPADFQPVITRKA
jgi:hypothetical protein